MPSATIGHTKCPECTGAALVKLSDKPGAKAYRWCIVCGAQYFTKNAEQDATLRAKMHPATANSPEPIISVTPEKAALAAPPSTPRPAPTPVGAERGLFSSIFRAS